MYIINIIKHFVRLSPIFLPGSEGAQPPETVTLDEKTPLNTNNPYERLTCGDAIPDTNPPLQPKWLAQWVDEVDEYSQGVKWVE